AAHLPAARRGDRGGEARGVPRRDRGASGRHARVPRVGLSPPALPAAAARGSLRRAPLARRGLRRLRGLRLVAHRQPGARGLPHVDAPAAALAALVERGGGRPLDAAALAGDLAVQPLPALRRGPRRSARRLLLRVGDAARAGGAAVAGRAMTAAGQRARIALAVPALLGIFVLGELLLDRHPLRLDLTPDARHTLSDQTLRALDALDVDVRVIAFLRSEDPRNLRIEDMLRQVSARTPRVHVEVVDVNRSPALARQYGVDSYGAIVVESGGRRRVFSNPSEEAFLGALLHVTRQQRKTVGWLVGHGEGDPTSTDHYRGYSTARRLLENEDYDVRPVSLIGDEVPPETTVLVIAGPKRDPLPEELAALDRYLQRPGQALVLLDAVRTPELAHFLHRYWVEVGDD